MRRLFWFTPKIAKRPMAIIGTRQPKTIKRPWFLNMRAYFFAMLKNNLFEEKLCLFMLNIFRFFFEFFLTIFRAKIINLFFILVC